MPAQLLVQAGIAASFLLADYVYHRWFADKPVTKTPPQDISIPRVDVGTPIPIIYGRCRVRAPILAWHQAPERDTGDDLNGWPTGATFYRMNMFFVLGFGFDGTNGTNTIHGMWAGEKKFRMQVPAADETALQTEIDPTLDAGIEPGYIGGFTYWYDGDSAQDVAGTFGGTTMIADGVSADEIPSYRGLLSILLYNSGGQWILGSSPNVPAYSFEASSYRSAGFPAVGTYARVGQDSNPVNALYDMLVTSLGKLGIPSSYIDSTTFDAGAITLYNESHGYSRCIEEVREAREHILELLKQIDGGIYFDEADNKFKLYLIRADFDPATIPHITKDNCVDLTDFAIGGWSNLPNKIRLTYTNADDEYREASATARNQANAVGQGGQVIEHLIDMPGISNADQAARTAARELAALSRPLIKCRAILDRSFIRLVPGQAVKVTWSNPDVAGLIFRVVAPPERGTLTDGKIAVDLLQDYNYSYRGRVPEPPALIDSGTIRGGLVGGLG